MPIDITVDQHVALVVLNRPQAMNSIDPEMRDQLYAAWDRIRTDDDIRVAIVTGAGDKAFCTGSDLKKTMPPKESYAELLLGRNAPGNMLHGFGTDKPLICAANGYAVGGGLELALACDICIASDNAKFGLTEVRIGSIPGSGGVQRLPRAVGKSNAMLMLLTGDVIDAAEALRIGLVQAVFPAAELQAEALKLARELAARPPLAVRYIKSQIHHALNVDIEAGHEIERDLFALTFASDDAGEGMDAFLEKRAPKGFTGT